jgi:hypothetical protein
MNGHSCWLSSFSMPIRLRERDFSFPDFHTGCGVHTASGAMCTDGFSSKRQDGRGVAITQQSSAENKNAWRYKSTTRSLHGMVLNRVQVQRYNWCSLFLRCASTFPITYPLESFTMFKVKILIIFILQKGQGPSPKKTEWLQVWYTNIRFLRHSDVFSTFSAKPFLL